MSKTGIKTHLFLIEEARKVQSDFDYIIVSAPTADATVGLLMEWKHVTMSRC